MQDLKISACKSDYKMSVVDPLIIRMRNLKRFFRFLLGEAQCLKKAYCSHNLDIDGFLYPDCNAYSYTLASFTIF